MHRRNFLKGMAAAGAKPLLPPLALTNLVAPAVVAAEAPVVVADDHFLFGIGILKPSHTVPDCYAMNVLNIDRAKRKRPVEKYMRDVVFFKLPPNSPMPMAWVVEEQYVSMVKSMVDRGYTHVFRKNLFFDEYMNIAFYGGSPNGIADIKIITEEEYDPDFPQWVLIDRHAC